jgi:uncharacterized protein (TIGR01319 family)
MVKGATPDVVLTAVELLATGSQDLPGSGDVIVVDVGGATTDVYSVVEVDPEDASLRREVVAATAVTRTVEGDLGMRWSAVPTVEAALEAGLTGPGLLTAAQERRADPGLVAVTHEQGEADLQIASAAVALAVRRHAGRQQVVWSPDGRLLERSGRDLREAGLLIGSGGVLRHSTGVDAERVLSAATGDRVSGGWLVPRRPRLVVDRDYVLAAAGLLAEEHPSAASRMLAKLAGPVPAQ